MAATQSDFARPRLDPFRPEALGQRLAPFVAAGTLGVLLLFGGDVTRLPRASLIALIASLALLASLYHPAWDRFPRVLQAIPLVSAVSAELLAGSGPTATARAITVTVLVVALLGAFLLPWARLPRATQAGPPLAVLLTLLVLHDVVGIDNTVALPFTLLVILWLALYHSLPELLFGLAVSVGMFVSPGPGEELRAVFGAGVLYASVIVIMGFSLAQLLKRLRQQADDTAMVESIMRRISTGDPDSARVALCDGALQVCDASAAVLMEPDEHGEMVPTAAAPNGITGWMTACMDSLSSLSQPVVRDDRVVGQIVLSWQKKLRRISDLTVATANLFATEAALVLQQADYLSRLAASEERLTQLAATDALTGLANRREFDHRLEAQRPRRFAVIAVDVDNLKELNDSYGHDTGDAALRAISQALSSAMRDGDLIARTGGDEFSAILPGAGMDDAEAVAERMRRAVRAIVFPQGPITISAGCAAAQSRSDMRQVLLAADDALYLAKQAGRNRVVSSRLGNRRSGPSSEAQDEVVELLATRQMRSVYQPIVCLENRTVVGFEALARPARAGATASVDRLFVASHQLGIDRDFDWLCRRIAVHHASGLPRGLPVFINVGVSALLDPLHDADQMLLLLRWARRPPTDVVLEITERDAIYDLDQFKAVLAAYRQEGFRFALDDIGEGHSTFEVLAAAVPEFIKISARFACLGEQPGPHSAVRALTSFARDTDCQVISEGLESEEHIALVRRLGVTLGQGYALGKPAARWTTAMLDRRAVSV